MVPDVCIRVDVAERLCKTCAKTSWLGLSAVLKGQPPITLRSGCLSSAHLRCQAKGCILVPHDLQHLQPFLMISMHMCTQVSAQHLALELHGCI